MNPVPSVEPSRERRPLKDCLVVVTPRSFGMHSPGLRATLEAEVGQVRYRPGPLQAAELAAMVADADGLLAGSDHITEDVFRQAPRLRVVARYGVGVDRIDLEAAKRHHVTVTVTPGANSNAVAELTIGLLFMLARPVLAGQAQAQAGQWPALSGVELSGKTLGLVGLGHIGSLVANKATALGMKVLAYDPYLRQSDVATLTRLQELVELSDFISLHVPLTEETRGIVGKDLLKHVKKGAVLVNTARGELVDEDTLLWALDQGVLRAAALDVLGQEPPRPGHPLLHRDDVIVTPHMSPHTAEATTAMGQIALQELLTALSGKAPRYAI